MVTLATVEAQLKAVGCNFRFWGRSELRELCDILLPGETIAMAVNGQYEAGFALLVATDFRVLLVDKKPKYLTLKDIRFDMITELDFAARMLNSTVRIYTPNKELRFTSTSSSRLRKLFTYTQHKVMEIRHRFMMQQFAQQHEIQNTPPGIAMAYMMQQPLGAPGMQYELPSAERMGLPGEQRMELQGAEHRHLPPAEHLNMPPMRQETHADIPPAGPPPMSPVFEFDGPPQSAPVSAQFKVADEPLGHHSSPEPASLYNPQSDDGGKSDHQRRLAAAMGSAGLHRLIDGGRLVKEYVSVPFTQRWRKRPYGFSRDSLPQSQ